MDALDWFTLICYAASATAFGMLFVKYPASPTRQALRMIGVAVCLACIIGLAR